MTPPPRPQTVERETRGASPLGTGGVAPRRGPALEPATHSETARQFVHMAMGGFALLLRWIAWWQALALAAAALLFNIVALPRIAHRLYRPGDATRGLHGIVLYPASVLLLIAAFPRRPDVVAAAWGILALGDGSATLVGRALGGPRWPWNRDKTINGSAAFAMLGGAAGIGLAWWCRAAAPPIPSWTHVAIAVAVAAIVAAAVETIPVRLDDNLSVAIAAGTVLWIALLVDPEAARTWWTAREPPLVAAFVTNLVTAWAGYRARTVSVSGAVAGALIGTIIFTATGWQGWLLLLAAFLAASATSRVGLKRKAVLGIAEERGGRRGAGNAIANTGVAAIAAAVAVSGADPLLSRIAFAAALVAGGSDTIASEIGKAWGRRTWSITTLGRVPPGTSGAMSLEGTAAGVIGAFALAGLAIALGLVPAAALFPIVIAATIGALVESWLGATLEGPGILNNDMLNFINTSVAAVGAAMIVRWIGA